MSFRAQCPALFMSFRAQCRIYVISSAAHCRIYVISSAAHCRILSFRARRTAVFCHFERSAARHAVEKSFLYNRKRKISPLRSLTLASVEMTSGGSERNKCATSSLSRNDKEKGGDGCHPQSQGGGERCGFSLAVAAQASGVYFDILDRARAANVAE